MVGWEIPNVTSVVEVLVHVLLVAHSVDLAVITVVSGVGVVVLVAVVVPVVVVHILRFLISYKFISN